MSDIASGANCALIPFGFKNLFAGILLPRFLTVIDSDIAIIKLDKCALGVVRAANKFMLEGQGGSNNTEVSNNLVLAVAGGIVAAT